MYKEKFKKFGGDRIPDIIEYLRDKIQENTGITITVGCDSIQKKRKTMYACTIMMYNKDIRNGAHVVFFRENIEKIRDNNDRLYREALMAYNIAEFLNKELSGHYTRQDIDILERQKYKFHILRCNGEHGDIKLSDINSFISNITLTEFEKNIEYKLVDIHLDFNPFESTVNSRGVSNNKSNAAYKSYVPWLKGLGYRVYSKPNSYAATGAADLLLQD